MSNVSPLLRKLLALTILVFAAYAIWMNVLHPAIGNFAEYEQGIERDRQFLARYLGHAAAQPGLDAELAELRKAESSADGLLSAATPALAAADLQDRLKRLITRSNGILKSVQVLPPENDESFRRIGVDIMIVADITRLKDILYDIETAKPYLFVDEIDVRRNVTSGFIASATTRGRIGPFSANEVLQVRFKVSGFMRGGNP